jgi:hypothetical protein
VFGTPFLPRTSLRSNVCFADLIVEMEMEEQGFHCGRVQHLDLVGLAVELEVAGKKDLGEGFEEQVWLILIV